MATSDIPNNIKQKIENASTKIKTLISDAITTHENTSNHPLAGGAPADISLTETSNAGTENKYAREDHVHKITKASITSYGITQLSDTIEDNSTLAATPKAVKEAYDIAVAANGNAGTGRSDNNFTDEYKNKLEALQIITVDDALDDDSTNPVQNKVIANALAGKVDVIEGKGLSTKDYTQDDKNAVDSIPNYLLKSKVINDFSTETFNSSDPTALSAYQGKVLNEGKFNKSGGEITGDVSLTGTETNSEGKITAKKIVVSGGSANQFLKADGTLDNSSYVKTTDLASVATSGSYKDLSNIPTYSATITNSTSGYYEIGKLKLDGTNNISLYGKDTNTIYTNGDGLSLTNNVFSANFGTGNTNVARGNHDHDNSYSPLGHTHNFYDLNNKNQWTKVYESNASTYQQTVYCNGMFVYLYLQTGTYNLFPVPNPDNYNGWNYCGKLDNEISDDYLPPFDIYQAYLKGCIIRIMPSRQILIATEQNISNYVGRAGFLYPYKLYNGTNI